METPTMSDMRATQGAIVARFMAFFQRKCSLVIDLRKELKDVQFHPVKMMLFIKFSGEGWRDAVVERLQSAVGVTWGEYGVRVKGYGLV